MKAGWEVKELGKVSAIHYGYTESACSEPVGPRFLRITDIQDDYVDWDNVPYCKIEEADQPKYRLASGDIVFARTGATTGKSFLVKEPPDAVFASYLIRLRLLGKELLPEFVAFFFQTSDYWKIIKEGSSGSAQGGFNATKLAALLLRVPPIAEQRRIVGLLTEAFAGIATLKANAERNFQNARALLGSHRQAAFTKRGKGWSDKTLAELCDIKHGFAFKSEYFTSHGDYVLLTPGNFYESGGYRDRGVKQKYYSGEIPKGFVLAEGDLVVAMTEQAPSLLGSPVLIPESRKFLHNQRLGLVTKKPGVPWVNEFFFHVFNTPSVRQAIHDGAAGVKVRHTSPTKIGEVAVSFPTSVDEQLSIVSNFRELGEQTQRLETIYQQELAALDELKMSLLHQAFTGQL